MKAVDISGHTGTSRILIGERLKNLGKYIPVERSIIITDTNVRHYHEKDFPGCPVIEIGTGEGMKNLDTVQTIYEKLLDLEADRSTFIVGIGGGVVCDIVGFAASTFMRGVDFGFVSSSLLSQVDASVGGKNGVNFKLYKNIVGTFNQPEFVICDIHLLRTLERGELLNGFAEIVKHAAIADAALFSFLEKHHRLLLELDTDVLERLVHDSVGIKAAIVNRDERESSERRLLNFGHTFGHALEKTSLIPHGRAVSIGMVMAADLSVRRKRLAAEEASRVRELLMKLQLPVAMEMDPSMVLDAVRKDKKRESVCIKFVLLNRIGSAVVEGISIEELEDIIDDLCQCG